ncbi:hypothetical protein LTR37_008929 [Vermiconidia calcicola]|uniref:Uncharacterized protein n=1 Tax=Vermiconidia calcicola TaxID=1690605 RepID=A0ACC3NB37_9PEZI|nr:hypothetical protein LTR37_008929 [Vermiconidia calcicola]
MFSTLQPSRPKTHPAPSPDPLHQQQIRGAHPEQQRTAPSNQIEAMPPHKTPMMANNLEMQQNQSMPVYNPATTHPVFFTNWRKPPFPMPTCNGFSPAATGYVFGDSRKRYLPMTKL